MLPRRAGCQRSQRYAVVGAIVCAIVGTVCLNTLLAVVRLFGETFLRKRLSLTRIKNLQAMSHGARSVLFYIALYVVLPEAPPLWFDQLATLDLRLVDYSPTSFPLSSRLGEPAMVLALLVAVFPLAAIGRQPDGAVGARWTGHGGGTVPRCAYSDGTPRSRVARLAARYRWQGKSGCFCAIVTSWCGRWCCRSSSRDSRFS